MSAREFSKVSPAVWRSGRFISLSDRGKVAYFYLITNAHVTSAGCYHLPDGYAAADLKWPQEDYLATRDELIGAELIDFDPEHSVVLIERWFKHNPPTNDDYAKGTLKRLDTIENERLREKALADFSEANSLRIERAAEKAARKQMKAAASRYNVAELVGNPTRLLGTRLMRGDR
jgi:hypothetical protein